MLNLNNTEIDNEHWINRFESELAVMEKDTNKKYKIIIEEINDANNENSLHDKFKIEIGNFRDNEKQIQVYDVNNMYKEIEGIYPNYSELVKEIKLLKNKMKKGCTEKVVNVYKNSLFDNHDTVCTWKCDSCGNNAHYIIDNSYMCYFKSFISTPIYILDKYNSVNDKFCSFCDEYRYDKWHDVIVSNHSYDILKNDYITNKKIKIGSWKFKNQD